MGKEQWKVDGSKTCILKFDMHCQCNGCIKKINDGVKEISLSEGVESVSLLMETGEVKVAGRMDPEKLCSVFHAVTKKCVEIVTQSTLYEGRSAQSQEKKLHGQAPLADRFAPELSISGWPRNGAGSFGVTVTPSAPPLPLAEAEAWSELTAVPCEQRCWYRWAAPRSSLGVWAAAAADITGTLAMYEL